MKKVLFSLLCLLFSIAPISYCLTPEQRALMATESFKDNCAFRQIQTIAACNGDKDAIEACILGEPYKTLDLSGLLAKWWYLLYGKNKNFIAKGLDYGFSSEELRVFNKLPAIEINKIVGRVLKLNELRINDLDGLARIPLIDQVDILWINDNQITELKPKAFIGFNNLKILTLSNNKISEVKSDAFKGLSGLTDLILQNNKLTKVPGLSDGLGNIQHIFLDRNPLAGVSSDLPNLVKGHDRLQTISLDEDTVSEANRTALRVSLKNICAGLWVVFATKDGRTL